ncbi:MAG: hypothetical protein OWT28_08790 [Firmicutes bacterium]|nr:hypothetical protein [Bacillota bacterium]
MQKLLKSKWLLGLTAIGILLLVFGAGGGLSGTSGNTGPPAGATPVAATPVQTNHQSAAVEAADAYETQLDQQLEHMLDQIAGISGALVMVRVDSTTKEDFGQNLTTSRSTSSDSGSKATTVTTSAQSQVVTVSGANGTQSPLVTEQELPHITGVLVVASAQDDVQMEAEVTSAVQDVLGIPAYKITVLPRR